MQVGRGRDEGELVTSHLSRDGGRLLAIVAGGRGARHLKKLPCGTSTRGRCMEGYVKPGRQLENPVVGGVRGWSTVVVVVSTLGASGGVGGLQVVKSVGVSTTVST